MNQHIRILRDKNGRYLKYAILILIDDHMYNEINIRGIEFGACFKNNTFIGLNIITRNGKEFNDIDDRSVSKLFCGIKYKHRNPKDPFDFRKEAYMWNIYNTTMSNVSGNSTKLYESLTLDELKFHIEYLNLLRIKAKVESSEKFKIIKEKMK